MFATDNPTRASEAKSGSAPDNTMNRLESVLAQAHDAHDAPVRNHFRTATQLFERYGSRCGSDSLRKEFLHSKTVYQTRIKKRHQKRTNR